MNILVVVFVMLSCVVSTPLLAEPTGKNHYVLEGAVDGRYEQAKCSLYFSKYGKNWTLQLRPENAYGPSANLFFSPKFGSAEPGSYPVQYAYRGSAATLGGSVTSDGDMYSIETEGQVEFTRFDDRVVGNFSFITKDNDGVTVSAEGAFDCPRGEALQ
ncbi:hypothetical protein [Algiphilus sp.]|uniref:hypothetical protein n=1 Tax=Algiphilus sp. TaxID=1872431 RepID=UPI003B51CAAF